MSAGLLFGLLGLAQLCIALLADRAFDSIDKPLFSAAADAYPALDIKDWFSETTATQPELGKRRTSEVLRIARLASAARQTMVALLVAFISDAVTFVIVMHAHPAPSLRGLRLLITGAAAGVTLIALIGLLVLANRRGLRATAQSHSEFRADDTRKGPLGRYFARVFSPETLTPYLTVSFLGSAVAIVAAIGL